MNVSAKVPNRIQALCNEQSITLNKLATLSGVTQSTLNSIMKGESKSPSVSTIEKICKALGITVSEFFDDPIFQDKVT
jgi:transcriptional regulator with XRE-family HTH domain